MTDEMIAPEPLSGSPLRLIETGAPDEYLVRRHNASDVYAAAVIRSEPEGFFAYPHQAPYHRLGPFGSPPEALNACRAELSKSDDRVGEVGGA